jgi:hypothetical protein
LPFAHGDDDFVEILTVLLGYALRIGDLLLELCPIDCLMLRDQRDCLFGAVVTTEP